MLQRQPLSSVAAVQLAGLKCLLLLVAMRAALQKEQWLKL